MTIRRLDKTERLSRVVVHGGVAYLSGLTASDRQQDTHGQTEQILAKTDEYLETLGVERSSVLSANIWLADMADFDDLNRAWMAWIDRSEPPARATVQAILGLPDIRVEIQFTVAVPLED